MFKRVLVTAITGLWAKLVSLPCWPITWFVVASLVSMANPFKSSRYWSYHYLVVTRQAYHGQNAKLRWLIQTERLVAILTMVYLVFIYFFPPHHDNIEQMIIFDIWDMAQVSRIVKLELIFAVSSVLYLNWSHYNRFYTNTVVYNFTRSMMTMDNNRDHRFGGRSPPQPSCELVFGKAMVKQTIHDRVIKGMKALHLFILALSL